MKLLNLKLTPGDKATPLAVWAELGKLFVQRFSGALKPTGPVKSGRPQVDVSKLTFPDLPVMPTKPATFCSGRPKPAACKICGGDCGQCGGTGGEPSYIWRNGSWVRNPDFRP